jgi:glycosyltransferase involved in cell wall biosynthesis
MRFFYIDPFLKYDFGHYFEVAQAIKKYFASEKKDFYLIGNIGINENTKKIIGDVIPLIQQTCFEDLENKGESFAEDLINLHKIYSFSERDLLIIPAAYENQIYGVGKFFNFLKQNKGNYPKVAMQFHQLYPPTKESDDLEKPEFKQKWENRLAEAFSVSNFPSISYWSTESSNLNNKLSSLSKRDVGVLSVPFNTPANLSERTRKDSLIIGFLGDGRQEKGLSIFLRSIPYLIKSQNNLKFVVQNLNPRGFSETQENEIKSLLKDVSGLSEVRVINGSLSPEEYDSLFRGIDIVVLPYDPKNYSQRASGIFMQASIYRKLVVVSSGTWLEESLKKNRASGKVFDYIENKDQTVNNLTSSILNLINEVDKYHTLAVKNSNYYSRKCTAKEFITNIVEYYEHK